MKVIKSVCTGLVLVGLTLASCTSNNQKQEEHKTKNKATEKTEVQEKKNPVLDLSDAERNPNGSFFKMTIGGKEKIFDNAENKKSQNQFISQSNILIMSRFTKNNRERISLKIFGFKPNKIKAFPIDLAKDTLGMKVKCKYYNTFKDGSVDEILDFSKSETAKIVINEIKGDSIIGNIQGFFSDQDIVSKHILKIEDGEFRFKIDGLNQAKPNL